MRSGSASGRLGSTSATASYQLSRTLCTTPCVADLRHGPHTLRFTATNDSSRTSEGHVNIDQSISVYRHAIGIQRHKRWKAFIGWPVAIFGLLAAVGGIVVATDDDRDVSTGALIGGEVVAAGLMALGGWLIYDSVTVTQPGSGVQYPLKHATQPVEINNP